MADFATDKVFSLYRKYGGKDYIGESVSQLEHAIQCAMLAEKEGHSTETILGAFLHDIGHLTGMEQEKDPMVTDGLALGVQKHEEVGENFLRQLRLPAEVTDIVRGHVDAKRYLTYKDKNYYNGLSTASKMTLKHQGGPMSASEAEVFESKTNFGIILQMRTWDEQAKVPGLEIEAIEKYETMFHKYMTEILAV